MGDKETKSEKHIDGAIPKEVRSAIMDAAAKQAAAAARKQVAAALAIKDVAHRTLRRQDVETRVQVPRLAAGGGLGLGWNGPIIGDSDSGDGGWLLDSDPNDTVVKFDADNRNQTWWADMSDSTDPT